MQLVLYSSVDDEIEEYKRRRGTHHDLYQLQMKASFREVYIHTSSTFRCRLDIGVCNDVAYPELSRDLAALQRRSEQFNQSDLKDPCHNSKSLRIVRPSLRLELRKAEKRRGTIRQDGGPI